MKALIMAAIGGVVAIAAGIGISLSMTSQSSELLSDIPPDPPTTNGPTMQDPPPEPPVEPPIAPSDPPPVEPPMNQIPEGSSDVVAYQVYEDRSQKAFTMLIPAGWNPSSSVVLSPDGVLKTAFFATSPDNMQSIGFERPRQYSYLMPVGIYTEEGQTAYAGSILIYYYRPADQYVDQILLPQLASIYPDIHLEDQLMIQDGAGFSAGFFEFSYSNDGVQYTVQSFVTTYGAVVSGQIPNWESDTMSVSAPTATFDEVAEQGWNAIGSMRANPNFVQNYIQQSGQSAAFQSQSYNESFFSALRHIQESQNRLDGFQGLSDATLGYHAVRDPNGTPYTVPNSHNFWFVGSSGTIYGSNTGQPQVQENLSPLQ